MTQLTVGYAAGIIAAGIFVARLWSPNTLTFIISGLLQDRSSAATWTVASRALQCSHWPDVLQTDSVLSHGVRKDILLLTKLIPLMGGLIAIAGVVTPLGLHEALLPSGSIQTPFQYIADTSSFGYGTPPRSNYSFNRMCGDGNPFQGYIKPCPFSDTVSIVTTYPNGTISYDYPYGVDLSIPKTVLDTYSSGTDSETTVSNFFDIQWRRYTTTNDDLYNNGSSYLVGAFRNMESLLLRNTVEPVEGLVVDTVNGGIGFRNHTIPPGFQHGVTWKEDLLFIEPETVCVDTNLTLDYMIIPTKNNSDSGGITNVVLTDRGGFVNLNHTYPEPDLSNPQKNPDLFGRAYKAAWLNNAYTALWYNVTDENNAAAGTRAFSYLNSELNKTFPIPTNFDGSITGLDFLGIGVDYGTYLSASYSGLTNASDPGATLNPFGITPNNFSDIYMLCTGAGNGDFANITNILVNCGMMRGVPQRQSPGSRLIFDSGSSWSQPIYTCASAIKATIKTVSFNYNGTDSLLSSLTIPEIQDKTYANESSMPLWGVENTGNAYYTQDMNLIWGLVSPAYENNQNVSTVRQPSLYLPGWIGTLDTLGMLATSYENLPGSDFSVGALATAYDIGGPNAGQFDYSGQTNMAMWSRWQTLTNSPRTAALIPNLIYTDIAAAAVVGTKGVLGPGNAAHENQVALPVTPTVSKIQYHYPFAIPALAAALILVVITLLAFVTVCLGGLGIGRMRLHLQQISPGRVYTTFMYRGPDGLTMNSKDWSKQFGKKMVDLSGEFPVATNVMPQSDKGFRVSGYETSCSNDRSAEGEGLVAGVIHSNERSEGDIGGYGFAH
ncbi:hypothetical protein K432DRAFT_430554 [Lepidopterella palustris CBS 459.81]|uniref:Uncharacterized protein n=1 Tax=Lepidopterella palustris CBS 459.81 TaxID=1314670 RepID=A0A8E2DXM5_9PEZI|nr:hypothetical protein K432DRAFT_430554 [Lepidopterella palustris CBS 459.81]